MAILMERELAKNDHKGNWSKCSLTYLRTRLQEEVKELERALDSHKSKDEICSEAADIANFAMMIADVYRKS